LKRYPRSSPPSRLNERRRRLNRPSSWGCS